MCPHSLEVENYLLFIISELLNFKCECEVKHVKVKNKELLLVEYHYGRVREGQSSVNAMPRHVIVM